LANLFFEFVCDAFGFREIVPRAVPHQGENPGKWGQENGVRVQILTKCLSNPRFPSITEKSLHFGRQLGFRFSPIEPSGLLAHVRSAANHTFPDK